VSIGAINSAIIAGNAPQDRVTKLRDFWETITSQRILPINLEGDIFRQWRNQLSATRTILQGQRGFFTPRFPNPWLLPSGAAGATSFYDTAPLRETLLRLVDFDRINSREKRFSVGAVNVRTGNFIYFDNQEHKIAPEHIMASGALPPGFPPVVIDGEYYWDGGLVSNTPLQYVLDHEHKNDLTVYQVDLFSAQGPLPRSLEEAAEREKDIRYSSRTRMNTDASIRERKLRAAFANLVKKLPKSLENDPDLAFLKAATRENALTVVQLIYRDKPYEGGTKDYEFSRKTMLEHWIAGVEDARKTMAHHSEIEQKPAKGGAKTFDVHRTQQKT